MNTKRADVTSTARRLPAAHRHSQSSCCLSGPPFRCSRGHEHSGSGVVAVCNGECWEVLIFNALQF